MLPDEDTDALLQRSKTGLRREIDVSMLASAVPALGQHTEALLNELGFSTDVIRDLREAAVI